jgi:hypothetical protein
MVFSGRFNLKKSVILELGVVSLLQSKLDAVELR